MKDQKTLIAQHLRHKGSLTTLVATRLYQICRLSERIRELERAPFNLHINHTPIHRNGRRYVAYSLVEYGKKAA